MMKSLSCISALILSAALLVLVSAQPSGTFLSESYHVFPDCNINSTYYFYLTRYGSDVTCQPSTNGFTYRSCNASHRLDYTCTDSLCAQDCNLTSGIPRQMFNRRRLFFYFLRSLFLQLRIIFKTIQSQF
jgi:hypothetical protein